MTLLPSQCATALIEAAGQHKGWRTGNRTCRHRKGGNVSTVSILASAVAIAENPCACKCALLQLQSGLVTQGTTQRARRQGRVLDVEVEVEVEVGDGPVTSTCHQERQGKAKTSPEMYPTALRVGHASARC